MRTSARLSWQFGLGSNLGGTLDVERTHHDVGFGFVASAGGAYRLFGDASLQPFVIVGFSLAGARSSTRQAMTGDVSYGSVPLTSFDARLSATLGDTFFGFLTPYVAARVFGGPVLWTYQRESISGGDAHHYQLGGGLAVAIAHVVDLYVEGVPLGEKRLAAGAGFSF